MFTDHIEGHWIDAFCEVLDLCRIRADETVAILTESQSRPVNIHLTELALARLRLGWFGIRVPTPPHPPGPIVRSTGAAQCLNGQEAAVRALCGADVILDLTVEGLMHAPQTATILKTGARVLNISNEHPEALARLRPDPDMKEKVREAVARCRGTRVMTVTSPAGTDLTVAMTGAATVGVWGWTDRPGTLAHWPGGIVVSFPGPGSVNGRLVMQPGDMNLTFKRYIEGPVTLDLTDDMVTAIVGEGTDARLMRAYLDGFGDSGAYATSHVGWGLNPAARWEALTTYDRAHLNATELRAVAGNFLYSTGANEFAGRHTAAHLDLPMMGCTIELDGHAVVRDGRLT